MSTEITMKQGDRLPILSGTIDRPNGSALGFDQADVSTIEVKVRKKGASAYLIDAAITSATYTLNDDDATTSIAWTYEWADGDTDTLVKDARLDILVTLTDGREVSFPNDDYGELTVIARA